MLVDNKIKKETLRSFLRYAPLDQSYRPMEPSFQRRGTRSYLDIFLVWNSLSVMEQLIENFGFLIRSHRCRGIYKNKDPEAIIVSNYAATKPIVKNKYFRKQTTEY